MTILTPALIKILRIVKTQPFSTEVSGFAGENLSFIQAQKEALKEAAEAFLTEEMPRLTYADFTQYEKTGDRQAYQVPYYLRRKRLLTFSLLVFLEPENTRYCDALCEVLWAICSEPFWAIPAHFLDTQGDPLPFEEYETLLDLFASETACALSESLCLTRAYLPPLLVATVEQQVWRRCLAPFANGEKAYRFEGMKNNWSAVCGSAIGIAAIHLVKDETLLANLLHRAVASNEVYLASFGADGICTEGVDYWAYGFGFFTCFAALLAERTGGAYDYFTEDKVNAIARTGSAFYLSGQATISFSDGSEDSKYRRGLACFLHQRTGAQIPPEALAADCLDDPCGRFCLGIRDFFWACAQPAEVGTAQCGATWYPNAEWFLAKMPTLALAAKAGHNGESHNHNDCGSFSLYCKGKAVVCDLGAGLYDKFYFDDAVRYTIFVNRSASHNIPLLAGQEQCAGRGYTSTQVTPVIGKESACFEMQLEHCYPQDAVQYFARRYDLAYSTDAVRITDTVQLASGAVSEVFCAREPIVLGDGVALFSRQGAQVQLTFDAARFTPSCEEVAYIDHNNQQQIAYLLHLITTPCAEEMITSDFTFSCVTE